MRRNVNLFISSFIFNYDRCSVRVRTKSNGDAVGTFFPNGDCFLLAGDKFSHLETDISLEELETGCAALAVWTTKSAT